MSPTPRLSLPVPASTAVADIPGDIEALADRLDTIAAWDDQGTLASRPSPTKRGRYYFATDTGQLFRDTGTAWTEIQVGSIAKADLATDALNAFLKLAAAGDWKVKWGSGFDDGASWGISPERTWTIPHGLGADPVLAIALSTPAVSSVSAHDLTLSNVESHDATNLHVRTRTLLGGNCNFPGVSVSWVAIAAGS